MKSGQVPGKRAQDPYQALADAIILQAVKDFRAAARKLRKHPDSKAAIDTMDEVSRFLCSGWFMQLTGADGRYILNRLREEERYES